MPELVNKYFPVLDHGFVALKDYMGSDQDIEEAARVSYGGGNRKASDTRNLLRYLMRMRHTSPFEMAEIKLHMGLPIFVARQAIRHRVFSTNEFSGRYSVMPSIFYEPSRDRYVEQSKTNKQGSNFDSLIFDNDGDWEDFEQSRCISREISEIHYNWCIKKGISREIARIDLPLSTYTYWYWKVDLHNLLHFLELRLDEHAQWEIRQYAKIIAGIVGQLFPLTWEAFCDYRLYGAKFSYQEMKGLIDDKDPEGLSRREYGEFKRKISELPIYNTYPLDISSAKDHKYFEDMIAKSL